MKSTQVVHHTGSDGNVFETVHDKIEQLLAAGGLDATLTGLAALTGAQGDLIYGTGVDAFAMLAKSTTATHYLSNTGASNAPAWARIVTSGITDDAVTYAKIQNVSATSRIMGRSTSGAGDMEELAPATVDIMFQGLSSTYNIVSYGAVGDGSTNNTVAIQAAIDACLAAGGGTVYVPEGIFRTGPVTIDTSGLATGLYGARVSVVGAGKSSSIIKVLAGNQDWLFTCEGGDYVTPPGSAQQSHLIIRDLSFLGDGTTGGSPGQQGLILLKCVFTRIENVNITSFGSYGLNIFDTDQSSFSNVTIRGNTYGVTINDGTPNVTGPNSMVFEDCAISNNTEWGIDGHGLQAVSFIGGSIQYNGDTLGGASNWGARFVENNGAGYGTINFYGTIFEGNRGTADVWIDYDTPDFVTVNFIGCAWFRTVISATTYASTNGVKLDGNSTNLRANFQGNVWFDGGGYDDDAARPWIAQTNANAKIYSDGSDFFRDNAAASTTVEHPNFKGYLHLPTGSGISFEFNDVVIGHSSNTLTFSGGTGYNFQTSGAANIVEQFRTDAHGSTAYISQFDLYGKDSGGNNELYASIRGYCFDNTATSEDGQLVFGVKTAGTYANEVYLNGTELAPIANDGNALGVTGARWADAFLADGGVIDLGTTSSRATLTHVAASDSLTIHADPDNATAGSVVALGADGTISVDITSGAILPRTNDALTIGSASLGISDQHYASGATINFANGDAVLTHSSGVLNVSTGALQVGASAVLTQGTFGAWTSYSPTPTPGAGAYTTVTCTGAYLKVNKLVIWRGLVTFTTINTGTGYCQITLPGSTTAAGDHSFFAVDWNTSGDAKAIFLGSGTTYIRIYDMPAFAAAHNNGDAIPFCITYECT